MKSIYICRFLLIILTICINFISFFTIVLYLYSTFCMATVQNYFLVTNYFFKNSYIIYLYNEKELPLNTDCYKTYYFLMFYNKYTVYKIHFYIENLNIYTVLLGDNTFFFENYYTTNYNYYYKVFFFSKTQSFFNNSIIFICLQDSVYITVQETLLVFFRISNCTYNYIQCISIYMIYPIVYINTIAKIQCFCFNELYITPLETIELPVVFFLEYTTTTKDTNIYMYYLLLFNVQKVSIIDTELKVYFF